MGATFVAPHASPDPELHVLNLRVALVNDWLDTWAGEESVLEQVALLFRKRQPEAALTLTD